MPSADIDLERLKGNHLDVMMFDAVADCRILTDGAISAASQALTSASSSFTGDLVGATVYVPGAGAAGVPLKTTVDAVPAGGHTLTLHDAAITTVSSAKVAYGTDSTQAFLNAIAWIESNRNGKTRLFIPAGTYLITSTITITKDQVILYGAGMEVSTVVFAPTAAGAAFMFNPASTRQLTECAIESLRIYSTDTYFQKIAIDAVHVSEFRAEKIDIHGVASDGTWSGANSMGVRTRGKEHCTYDTLSINSDSPLVFGKDLYTLDYPADIDHFVIRNTYLVSGGTSHPIITIEDGCNVANLTIEGRNSWNRGSHGLYWVDTSATITAATIIIKGPRWEQGASTGHGIHIDWSGNASARCQSISVKNYYGATYPGKGIYLRKCFFVNIDNCLLTGDSTALDIDETCADILVSNLFAVGPNNFHNLTRVWQQGPDTENIAGLTAFYTAPSFVQTSKFLQVEIPSPSGQPALKLSNPAAFNPIQSKVTAAGTDEKYWDLNQELQRFGIRAVNDAYTDAHYAIVFHRTGDVVDEIRLPGGYFFVESGYSIFNGSTNNGVDCVQANGSVLALKTGDANLKAQHASTFQSVLLFYGTALAASNKIWDVVQDGTSLRFRAISDDRSSGQDVLQLKRSGTSPNGVLVNTNLEVNGDIKADLFGGTSKPLRSDSGKKITEGKIDLGQSSDVQITGVSSSVYLKWDNVAGKVVGGGGALTGPYLSDGDLVKYKASDGTLVTATQDDVIRWITGHAGPLVITDISGLQAALDGKANHPHTHSYDGFSHSHGGVASGSSSTGTAGGGSSTTGNDNG